ncbi:hypothetical protein CJJ07_000188 [Candidozyma auris]|nr:hypothetical protein CJJ07_000188 [[Candida] auris]QEL60997.1 hypothetical protein CJJ09_003131 [[Candida] auris]
MHSQVNSSIVLDEREETIKKLLVNFCDEYNSYVPDADKLELRITGGWVRDKLLGKESHDLDIAVNVLSGEEFASKLLEYTEKKGIKLGANSTSLHTIKKNPEKSKHLETCTARLFGLDVDFVNLRSEQYTEESRVPIVDCGTAEEDALRRDATLNALFYNLNRNKVEDFTGRGIEDLKNGLLRTPLQPLKTFVDDPLRVLRLIRFAARFDFVIEPATLSAMKDSHIRSALVHKISRERVGVETDKILTGNNVSYGLRLLNHVGFSESIFNPGVLVSTVNELNDKDLCEQIRHFDKKVSSRIDAATQHMRSFTNSVKSANDIPLLQAIWQVVSQDTAATKALWLCVILEPYSEINVRLNPRKKSLTHYPEVILKEGLRFGKADYDTVSNILKNTSGFTTFDRYFENPSQITRSDLGLYIRQYGDHFPLSVAFGAFSDYLKGVETENRTAEVPTPDGLHLPFNETTFHEIAFQYESLLETIKSEGLEKAADLKPVVDGKMISKALNKKPGPWMKDVTHEVVRWQLDHPHGNAEECIEHLRSVLN